MVISYMKKNLEIIFVRHGQSYGNVTFENQPAFDTEDPPLTEEGLKQAELLSKRFGRGDIDRIFSSTLIRAVQTAKPTAEKLSLKIQLVSDLVEVGTKTVGTDHETPVQSFERAQKCLDYIFSVCNDNERVLVVSHGTFLGYLIRCALGLGAQPTFRLQEDNCAITHIAFFEDDTPKLKYANDTFHLL